LYRRRSEAYERRRHPGRQLQEIIDKKPENQLTPMKTVLRAIILLAIVSMTAISCTEEEVKPTNGGGTLEDSFKR